MGGVDVTSVATVPADQRSRRRSGPGRTASSPGCRRGRGHRGGVRRRRRPSSSTSSPTATGSAPGDEVARVTAPTRSLLTAERTALNLLCHLSASPR